MATASTALVMESESTERPAHAGTVSEVLREQPPRYRIAWDDGHESIYTPAAPARGAHERRYGELKPRTGLARPRASKHLTGKDFPPFEA